jgi:hypothetical protein
LEEQMITTDYRGKNSNELKKKKNHQQITYLELFEINHLAQLAVTLHPK